MQAANVQNFKTENVMNKTTKVYMVQFLCFAIIFLIIRYTIGYFGWLSGYWIPIVSGVLTIFLAPQFKVFKVDGKETVFVAWIFSNTGKPVHWL